MRKSMRQVPPFILIVLGIFLLGEVLLILRGGSGLFTGKKRSIDSAKPMVALTFDDGPGEASARILDCLEKNGAVATFFEVGQNVDAYPELSKRAYNLGCEIGSHTYTHLNLYSASTAQLQEDKAKCDAAFQNAIGTLPTLLRPPGGNLGSSAKAAYAYSFIGWSVDTEDWRYRDASHVISAVKEAGNLDGQVILMHSLYDTTAEATEELIPWLKAQGYQLVTITELFQYRYGITPQPHLFYTVDYFLFGKDPY